MVARRGRSNFTEGPIFTRLLLFTLPIIATSLLQVAYNMADNIVVGQFSGDSAALAAVGQTSAYNGLLINLMIGISAGAGVVVAQLFGAARKEELSRSIHTSMLLSVIIGVGLCAIGLLVSRPILSMIISEENHALLLDKSTLYMLIICIGMPASSVYNFGASILRSLGDSKNPLVILGLSGLVNVALNLVFVTCFHMSIAGVALATIISQYISAAAVVVLLLRHKDESCTLKLRRLRIDRRLLVRILYCGIPAAIQSAIFSFANMLIASAIGTLPVESISANTIASNIDSITYQCMNAFSSSVMTFAGQNYGAMKKDRIWKSFTYATIQVAAIGIAIGQLQLLFSKEIAGLFVAADAVNREVIISETQAVMRAVLNPYFLCGVMGVIGGFLRGIGFSTSPMLASVVSVLSVRLIWIYVFFPMKPTSIVWLYLCYPITWIVTILIEVAVLIYAARKIKKVKPEVPTPEREEQAA